MEEEKKPYPLHDSDRVKTSVGLICLRHNSEKNTYEIIMVKKAITYCFNMFVSGMWEFEKESLMKLFNNMTYQEKVDILSLNFDVIWFRLTKNLVFEAESEFVVDVNKITDWRKKTTAGGAVSGNYYFGPKKFYGSRTSRDYRDKKRKFETYFLADGGTYLKSLIAGSMNVDTIWEFPKGRKSYLDVGGEIDTAKREFYEETGIGESKYNILWNLEPYVETYTDFGVTYKSIYYYAEAVGEWEPTLDFKKHQQLREISFVSWISKNDLRYMKLEKSTHQRWLKCFDKVIKKYRGHKKRIV
jgi:8-oxo-dGTP pyrophosphatase MutT (NUDIX family)